MADLREELTLLMTAHGRLTPRIMVDAARPEDSPLHSSFTWDDAIAGEERRLDQARALIRSVRVVYKEATEFAGPTSFRAYVSVPTDQGRAYLPTEAVLQDPFQRRVLVNQMHRDMAAMREKYHHLQEWSALIDEFRAAG